MEEKRGPVDENNTSLMDVAYPYPAMSSFVSVLYCLGVTALFDSWDPGPFISTSNESSFQPSPPGPMGQVTVDFEECVWCTGNGADLPLER
jgi:hypothetical protein